MFYTIFFLLLIKHGVCDYLIQGRLSKYNSPKTSITSIRLWLHAFDHAIGTVSIFVLVCLYILIFDNSNISSTVFLSIVCLGFLDFLTHALIDYTKNRIIKDTNLISSDQWYWYVTGVDQMLHYTTYMVIVIVFDIYFF